MPMKKNKKTSDAVAILHERYYKGKPERLASLQQERVNAEVAQAIYDLRTEANLNQRQLAALVGTTASVICRLEDADYEGHSLTMLQRIARALNNRLEINFVPLSRTWRADSRKALSKKRSEAISNA